VLPAELRVAIYEAVLLNSNCSLAVLRTCQQIAREAKPTLYQRRLTFESQATLFDWIEHSRNSHLKRVRTLSLRLTDVGFRSESTWQNDEPSKRVDTWTLYQHELEKLDHALEALPNVANLTITPPPPSRSLLLKSLYFSFLALIPQRCPTLKRLTLHDSAAVLSKVPGLGNLNDVVFTLKTPRQHTTTEKRRESMTDVPGIQHVMSTSPPPVGKKRKWTSSVTPCDTAPPKRRLRLTEWEHSRLDAKRVAESKTAARSSNS